LHFELKTFLKLYFELKTFLKLHFGPYGHQFPFFISLNERSVLLVNKFTCW